MFDPDDLAYGRIKMEIHTRPPVGITNPIRLAFVAASRAAGPQSGPADIAVYSRALEQIPTRWIGVVRATLDLVVSKRVPPWRGREMLRRYGYDV